MALHGPIQVNAEVIGRWSARRTVPAPDPDGFAPYDCMVSMYADDPPQVTCFELHHRYDDGALVLAAEVLAEAVRLRQEKQPVDEIEDGFGGYWTTCGSGCDLQVVRPGKVQCNRTTATCPDAEETRP